MYITKQKYKCVKCGYEIRYSPHEKHDAPTTENVVTCPKCWDEFLKSIGEMKYIHTENVYKT